MPNVNVLIFFVIEAIKEQYFYSFVKTISHDDVLALECNHRYFIGVKCVRSCFAGMRQNLKNHLSHL